MQKMTKWMLVLAGVLVLSSCSMTRARIAMPEGFQADGEGYVVNGSAFRTGRTPVSFGPYVANKVTGWSLPSRWTVSGRHLGFGRESLRYGFNMQGNEAQCSAQHGFVILRSRMGNGEASIETPTSLDTAVLSCDLGTASLDLWNKGRDVVGRYDLPGGRVLVEGLSRIEGVDMRMGVAMGYRFMRDGRDLMVVDVMAPGRVTFAKGLDADTRGQLAMAAAALLMLSPE